MVLHEAGEVKHFDAGYVLDGEVDEGSRDAGEEADEERQRPLEEYVLQHLGAGSASPVVFEQVVLVNPALAETSADAEKKETRLPPQGRGEVLTRSPSSRCAKPWHRPWRNGWR